MGYEMFNLKILYFCKTSENTVVQNAIFYFMILKCLVNIFNVEFVVKSHKSH